MINNACITQIEVMAEIERDLDGSWCVAAIYADALEIDGKCPSGSRAWVLIPPGHHLYSPVLMHFYKSCHDDIDERWQRNRSWRIQPKHAGRAL